MPPQPHTVPRNVLFVLETPVHLEMNRTFPLTPGQAQNSAERLVLSPQGRENPPMALLASGHLEVAGTGHRGGLAALGGRVSSSLVSWVASLLGRALPTGPHLGRLHIWTVRQRLA